MSLPQTPDWALAIAFWLHMLATVSWVGGQAMLFLLVLPQGRKTLPAEQFAKFLGAVNKRLSSIGWISLATLVATGMLQLGANPNYAGFLAIHNTWAQVILIKHLVFFAILSLSAYQTWSIAPDLERVALRQIKGHATPEERTALERKETLIIKANLILSVLVLLLTAIARIS